MYAQEGRSADVGRDRLSDEIDVAVSALSAPARNCDRFATAAEATRAFQVSRGHAVYADACLWDDRDEIGAFIDWLFSPAEGEGK